MVAVGGAEQAGAEQACAGDICISDSEGGGGVDDGKTQCTCPGVHDSE